MATHVKELIEQNAKKLSKLGRTRRSAFTAPAWHEGHLAADRLRRDQVNGWQVRRTTVDRSSDIAILLIIDEAHLVSPKAETSYVQFILELLAINPYLEGYRTNRNDLSLGLGC
jgi:hypothetical protein